MLVHAAKKRDAAEAADVAKQAARQAAETLGKQAASLRAMAETALLQAAAAEAWAVDLMHVPEARALARAREAEEAEEYARRLDPTNKDASRRAGETYKYLGGAGGWAIDKSWRELDDDEMRAARQLDFTEANWSNSEPEKIRMRWRDLDPDDRCAARALGFTLQVWAASRGNWGHRLAKETGSACYVAAEFARGLESQDGVTRIGAPRTPTGSVMKAGATDNAEGGKLDQRWYTIEELAATAGNSDSERIRHEAACLAVAQAESFKSPTPIDEGRFEVGVRGARHVVSNSRLAGASGETVLQRAGRQDAAAKELRAALREAAHQEEEGLAGFLREMADQVGVNAAATVPEELRQMPLPPTPPGLTARPFIHRAQVEASQPKPKRARKKPDLNGWWPQSVSDIVEPGPLRKTQEWLVQCEAWHRAGGPDGSRPPTLAFGVDAIKPIARGRRWDLRRGAGDVREFRDDMPEREKQALTCIKLAEVRRLLAGCEDKELLDFLTNGVRFNADMDEHVQMLLAPNLLSLYRDGGIGAAAEQADDMVRMGFIATYEGIPCIPLRIIPRGVVSKIGTNELRGISDQGAPRANASRPPLLTSDTKVEVLSLNTVCRAGDWSPEVKDTVENATQNGAVLRAMADAVDEPVFEISCDYSKFFHRVFYNESELYQMGALVPTQGGELKIALELVMTMGAVPSSQIAQRLACALVQLLYRHMDKAEEAAATSYGPVGDSIMEARAKLPPDSYGPMARWYNILMYSDDASIKLCGIKRTVRFLIIYYHTVGSGGLSVPLSRAAKQQIGTCVKWLGCFSAAGIGIVWLPADKAIRAASGILTTLEGRMEVGEYRRLVGLLVSIRFMLGGESKLLHHIFRPMKPGEELDSGPATIVKVDELMRAVLTHWLNSINQCPGVPALAAIEPLTIRPGAKVHHIFTDAALEGSGATFRPGLGGFHAGRYWAIAISDEPGLDQLQIPHLEFIAAGVGILMFLPELAGAEHVCLNTDALATAIALTGRAKSPAMQCIRDALTSSDGYELIAPRLHCRHLAGAGNWASDHPSRGRFEALERTCRAMGISPRRLAIRAEARAFIKRAVADVLPILAQRKEAAERATPSGSIPGAPQPQPTAPSKPRRVAPGSRAQTAQPGGKRARQKAASPGAKTRGTKAQEAASQMPEAKGMRMGSESPSPTRPHEARPHWRPSGRAPANWDDWKARPHPRTPPSRASPGDAKKYRANEVLVPPTPSPRQSRPVTPSPPAAGPRFDASAPAAPQGQSTPSPAREAQPRNRSLFESPARPAPQRPPVVAWRAVPEASRAHKLNREGPRQPTASETLLLETRQELLKQVCTRMSSDASEHSIGADRATLGWMCEEAMVDEASLPDNSKKQLASNWRAWHAYCTQCAKIAAWRPDINGLDAAGTERENIIWSAALIWIWARMEPKKGNYMKTGPYQGQLRPPSPASALAVLRGIRRLHIDRGITPVPLTLATRRLKGLMRSYAEWIGPENCLPARKAPLNRKIILAILGVPTGSPILNKGEKWAWDTAYGISCRALVHTLAQTGFRKAEVALPAGTKHGKMHISFANLTWRIGGQETASPSSIQLHGLRRGDFAVIRPPPSKPDPLSLHWGNSLIWIEYEPEAPINAARALAHWELHAGVAPGSRRETPLFCGTEGVGSALRQKALDEFFHGALRWILPKEGERKPTDYSIHSFRSYLASALMATGRSDAEIQIALRWASTEALRIYKVTNAEQYARWLHEAESAELTGMRAIQLPRQLPQHDHELAMHALREAKLDQAGSEPAEELADTTAGLGDEDYNLESQW